MPGCHLEDLFITSAHFVESLSILPHCPLTMDLPPQSGGTCMGLGPPVPTELVSVFYLKTGSVQQEQEWSPQPT